MRRTALIGILGTFGQGKKETIQKIELTSRRDGHLHGSILLLRVCRGHDTVIIRAHRCAHCRHGAGRGAVCHKIIGGVVALQEVGERLQFEQGLAEHRALLVALGSAVGVGHVDFGSKGFQERRDHTRNGLRMIQKSKKVKARS